MEIETFDKNGFCLLRIKDDISHNTDLSQLKKIVNKYIDEGVSNLALSFSKESFFFSRTIAVLVQFMGSIKEREGNFAIIHPNTSMLEMIKLIGLGKLIETYTSEDAIVVH